MASGPPPAAAAPGAPGAGGSNSSGRIAGAATSTSGQPNKDTGNIVPAAANAGSSPAARSGTNPSPEAGPPVALPAVSADKAALDKLSGRIGIQATATAATSTRGSSSSVAGNQGATATAIPSSGMAPNASSNASTNANGEKGQIAAAPAKSPVNPPARPSSGGNTAVQPPSSATANSNAPSSNSNTRPTASGLAGSGTASPSGYKPFDYSQPLSTYSPANYGSGMRRSPATTPGAGQTSANASPNSNPIAAGFAYGATGQRAGSGLNPSNASQQQQQQQQQSGTASPSAGGNRNAQVQSRTGNNATPLIAPSIVSRTSGSAPPPTASGLSPASVAELEGIANSAAALASNGRLGAPITPLPKLPSPAIAPSKPSPNQQQAQGTVQQQAQNRYSAAYGSTNSLSAANAHAIRDPRTPNPVTESFLSRSPVSAGATSASNPASSVNRPPSTSAEQSRTGGIATPLAPAGSASPGATRPGAAGNAASPPTNANKDAPGQKQAGQTGPPVSAALSWRSLLDRPYAGGYGSAGGSQANRTQTPNQRAGHWFNPLAVKQQSSAQASAQAQAQAQAQVQAQAAGQRPPSSGASPAGSMSQSAHSPGTAPAAVGNAGSTAQQQANKRRTASTSAAAPPYNTASLYGNRPGSTSMEAKDGAQAQRAVTASPIVGASHMPSSTSTAVTGTQAGSAAAKGASPAHQPRPSYSMTYGERLQQLQAQSARDRERDREAREREMREREKTAAAIAAGPKTAQGSPPLSIARSPYYGLTGGSSSIHASGKAASPPAPAPGAAQSPLSPPRKAADRPSSTSAFGYLFGGGGASRVATEGGANQAGKASSQASHPTGVTSGGSASQPGQSGHYRSASSGAAGQAVSQQQSAPPYNRQAIPGSSAPISRTQNTGLGLSAGMAQGNWRAQGYNGTAAASPTHAQQATADRKPDVSPQLAAQQTLAQKAVETAEITNGHKRKRSDAQETPPSQAGKQSQATSQPPLATLHAMRQREGPLFTAEDIKGAALRPPLMIVRSDNVVKALHKISAQHYAASTKTSPPTAPFIGRVVYDPFIDPAQLLDGDLLRKGVGGKVEIWLDTEWLTGEVWEAGAPSHPAVSHPPSPASDDQAETEDGKMDEAAQDDGMQIDNSDSVSPVTEAPLQTTAAQRREDLPPSWTLWDLVPLRERKIWGTDVYTDDSDILAACIHSGWLRLGSTAPLFGASSAADNEATQKRRKRRRKPNMDHRALKITIVIAPKLIKYEGSLRAGVWSRSWGNTHDGVSYAIESVVLVEKARHRLTPSRWKAYNRSFTTLAKQRCSCTMACEHSDRPTLYPRSLKLGEMLVKAS